MSNAPGSDEQLVRTADSGSHWQPVLTVRGTMTVDILNGNVAFVQRVSAQPTSLYRTVDGGQTWQHLTTPPAPCGVEFLDVRHGWCVSVSAASGSEDVGLWRTTDGGEHWTFASQTAAGTRKGTPDALPFGCDKSVIFTTPTVGWSPFFCNGGMPDLYKTTDAGTTWHPNPPPPLPPGIPTDGGAGYGGLVANGSDIAIVVSLPQRSTAIATSSDDGLTWNSQLVPHPDKEWNTTLVDPTHWRLTDNRVVLSTDDAGRHWRTVTLPTSVRAPQHPDDDLKFLGPNLAWAIPYNPNGGPIWWTTGDNVWRPVTIRLDHSGAPE